MSTAENKIFFTENENYGQKHLANKQFNSERKHNVRKHALGEIKNVMHNQISITPFKGLEAGPSKSICTELLKRRIDGLKSEVNNQPNGEELQKVQTISINKTEELECQDLPAPYTCSANCSKGLEVIWSEANVLEPNILERIINGDGDGSVSNDMYDKNLTLMDLEDVFDTLIEMPDPYELEELALLDHFAEIDRAEFAAMNWIHDL